jgi:hypothetical protein
MRIKYGNLTAKEAEEIKKEIADLTEKMREKRKEIKLVIEIEERSLGGTKDLEKDMSREKQRATEKGAKNGRGRK